LKHDLTVRVARPLQSPPARGRGLKLPIGLSSGGR